MFYALATRGVPDLSVVTPKQNVFFAIVGSVVTSL